MKTVTKLKIELSAPENFLKVRETLTRMGIANNTTKTLYQSCHILKNKGEYYIVHFKELYAMDGQFVEYGEEDIERRNNIAKLIEDWGLVKIVDPEQHVFTGDNKFRIISHKDAQTWKLVYKYKIGS